MESSTPSVGAPSVRRLVDLIATSLDDQSVVLERNFWRRNAQNGRALLEATGQLALEPLAATRALSRIQAINEAIHDGRPTPGGGARQKLVAQAQGGAFCRMCGTTRLLHVDHVRPTSLGGSDLLPNLQLLCGDCNLGKGATLFGGLAAILVPAAPELTKGLRYSALWLQSRIEDGRPLAHCACGSNTAEERFDVRVLPTMAINIRNLRVSCERCEE